MPKRKSRLLSLAAMVSASLIALTSSAQADDFHKTDSQDKLAVTLKNLGKASGILTWKNRGNTITITNYLLEDSSCNNKNVYVEVHILDYIKREYTLRTDKKDNGCGKLKLPDLSWHADGRVQNVWLKLCEENWGSNDCAESPRMKNPYETSSGINPPAAP